MIFQLPNGFALYMLADNQGRRLEKAITNVVQDPVRNDANVTNAVSCFRCHWKGMIPAIDEIRPHFEKNAFAFTRREVDIVRSLYAPQDQMTKAFQDYDGRFAQAVGQLGFPYTFSSGETEPVTLLAKQFEGEIPLTLAAAELGLTVNQFQTLLQRTRFLTRRIGNVNNGSTIKRAVFEDNFGFIVDAFGLGRPFFFRQFGLTDAGDDDGEYTMSAPAEENKVSEPAE
jgi:hypothetical protein